MTLRDKKKTIICDIKCRDSLEDFCKKYYNCERVDASTFAHCNWNNARGKIFVERYNPYTKSVLIYGSDKKDLVYGREHEVKLSQLVSNFIGEL